MGTATVVGGAPEAATAFERKSRHLQHHTVHPDTTSYIEVLGLPLGLEAPVMTPNGVIFLFFST